jgi:hypothetical protein
MPTSRVLSVASLALSLSCGACHRSTAEQALPCEEPADRLGAGELVESTEVLFGLPVPEGMTVHRRLFDNAAAIGPLSEAEVAAYVRRRVEAHEERTEETTSFEHAHLRGEHAPLAGTLRIDVSRRGEMTVLAVWIDAAP